MLTSVGLLSVMEGPKERKTKESLLEHRNRSLEKSQLQVILASKSKATMPQ